MAVSYIAARPITLHGVVYQAGDAVDTTGWNPNVISEHLRLGWLTVSSQPNVTGFLHGPPSTYASGVTYVTNDTVIYNSNSYVSLVDANVGNTPDVSPTKWRVFASAVNGSGDLAVASLATDVAGTASGTYAAVAGLTVAPNTTSPIALYIEGGIKFTYSTTTGNIVARFQVQDDLGTVVGGPVQISSNPGAASANIFHPVSFRIPYTPAATARTYSLWTSTATAPASATWTMVGAGTWPNAGFALRATLR